MQSRNYQTSQSQLQSQPEMEANEVVRDASGGGTDTDLSRTSNNIDTSAKPSDEYINDIML